jgi:TP901 family phage tail tape measure protein
MSAGAVRAGKAFVEITANDTDFQRGLKRVQHSVVRLGNVMRQVGSGMAIAGGAMGLPMVLAARQAATFEDALLELQGAVSDITPGQMKAVREESLRLSSAMGVTPEKVSQAFALLIKAGLTVEEALSGATKSAIEFARVSGVDASQAAEFMKVAMNVFGIEAKDAAIAVNTLSAAADSSETSIASMVESFALVASVAKGTGQSLFGLSQGLAVLARYGIKGEEAGTGIKTLLVKLLAPAKDAKDALATLGLSMESLVDETGKLLPLAQLAGVFRKALGGMGKEARDAMLANEALVKVFDVRGIRVIQAFSDIGEKGFNDIATAMENSRTVSEKFSIAMSGITGSFERLYSAVQRMAIAFMVGAAPALSAFAAAAVPVMDFMAFIFTQVPIISPILAGMAVGLFGVGLAALGAGAMLGFMNFGLKNIINFRTTFVMAVRAMTSVIGNFSRALVGLRVAMLAIPGWGWALAALAAAGGAAAWMMSGSGSTAKGKGSGIKRDANRDPLANPMGGGMAAQARARGEALGTFSAAVASQLGIGPALTAADETAANTGRMADGVDALVRQGEARMPGAAALQAGMVPPGVRGGVAARSDRDLVSMSERAAIAAEESRTYLRQLVEKARDGGLAFA